MKKIFQISSLCALLAVGLFMSSCHKVEVGGEALFITGTEINPVTTLVVDTGMARTAISITSSDLVDADIKIDLQIDPSKLKSYNDANGSNYQLPPEGSYALKESSVVIQRGTHVSNAVDLTIESGRDLEDGVSYMVPVSVVSAAGATKVLSASRTVYVVLKKVAYLTAVKTTGTYFTCDFSQNNEDLKAMSSITFESKVYINRFANYDPFISTVMGIEGEYLLRFGDVTIENNQIQRAGGTGAALTGPDGLSTGQWYHLALTYDGSVEKLYVDGELVASQSVNRTIDLTHDDQGGFSIGRSYNGRYLDGMMSECRVWKKALTQPEIIAGMCGVDPATPGLVAYWKFNEGSGKVAHDISGNHHDAVAPRDVEWVPDVRCN